MIDFEAIPTPELFRFQNKMQNLHQGLSDKTVVIGVPNDTGTIDWVQIPQDERISNYIFRVSAEAHNELCKRFANPIDLSKLDSP